MGDDGMKKETHELCWACAKATRPFVEPLEEMRRKLVELNKAAEGRDPSRAHELERVHREAYRLARALDAILCAECKKLGPPCPEEE
jgi:hypothetical protein